MADGDEEEGAGEGGAVGEGEGGPIVATGPPPCFPRLMLLNRLRSSVTDLPTDLPPDLLFDLLEGESFGTLSLAVSPPPLPEPVPCSSLNAPEPVTRPSFLEPEPVTRPSFRRPEPVTRPSFPCPEPVTRPSPRVCTARVDGLGETGSSLALRLGLGLGLGWAMRAGRGEWPLPSPHPPCVGERRGARAVLSCSALWLPATCCPLWRAPVARGTESG